MRGVLVPMSSLMGALAQILPDSSREILEHLPAATYMVDSGRRIQLWNDACEELTGHRREEVLGRSCADNLLVHCDEFGMPKCGDACPLLETMRDGRPRRTDLFLRHKAGHRVPVRVRAMAVRDEHGVIVGACECMEERPMFLPAPPPLTVPTDAFLDPATDLPSRYILLARLADELQKFPKDGIPFGLLALGIDDFVRVCANDGPIGAGRVLLATAQTLSQLVGPANPVGRWGNGVFLAILHGCSEASLLASAVTLQRLAGMEAVPWWGDLLTITLSAGGTIVRPGDTVEELIRRAEEALARAVEMGANQAVII
jgi:diguanylate cyclase (GGDEF)-like protein/PAS domain S-box-containing protein